MATPSELQALTRLSHQAPAATWPFTATSTLLFGMRIFARTKTSKAVITWDDVIISVAWVLAISKAAFFQKALYSAAHIRSDQLLDDMATTGFWIIFTDSWIFLSIAVPKLSIGMLITQIFRPQRWLKFTILTLCIGLNVLALLGFILNIVQCDPVAGQWNPAGYPQTRCWNRNITVIYACTVGAISAFMDLAFAIYPAVIVWHLKMPTWKKISTMALLGLGLASFAFAVIKVYSNTALIGEADPGTLIYHGIRIGMWNSIENDFVLGAACLPFAPPFLRACKTLAATQVTKISQKLRPKIFHSLVDLAPSSEKIITVSDVVDNNKPIETKIVKDGSTDWFDREMYSSVPTEHDFA